LSGNRIPLWTPAMPRASNPAKLSNYQSIIKGDELVYWPSCAARNFSPSRGDDLPALPNIILRLLEKAGYRIKLAFDEELCCGQPFESKGHRDIGEYKRNELQAKLMTLSDGGRIPILSDTSPCVLRLNQLNNVFKVYDPIQFSLEHLLERIQLNIVAERVALHITCSTRKMGLAKQAEQLARRCAKQVVIPAGIECCGFAGDKGFTQPNLNASALSSLQAQVSGCSQGYSTSLSCEIGLSQHSDISYHSVMYLIERACS
jgi:D-lactate dehydrogenase